MPADTPDKPMLLGTIRVHKIAVEQDQRLLSTQAASCIGSSVGRGPVRTHIAVAFDARQLICMHYTNEAIDCGSVRSNTVRGWRLLGGWPVSVGL